MYCFNLHLHSLTVLPVVRRCELGIRRIVVMTAESVLDLGMLLISRGRLRESTCSPLRTGDIAMRTVPTLVVLAITVVLRS